MLKKFSLLCLISTITINSALALDLQEALSSAYANNSKFAQLRSEFLMNTDKLLKNKALRFLPNVDLDIGSRYKFENTPPNNNKEEDFTSYVTLKVSQNIFNGGRDILEIKAKNKKFISVRNSFYASEQKAIMECINIYLEYLAIFEKSKLLKSSLEESQKILETVQKMHEIGKIDKMEVLKAVNETSYIELQYMESLMELQVKRAKFIVTFDIEPDNIQTPTPDIPEIDMDESDVFNTYMSDDPDLTAHKYNILTEHVNLRITQCQFLPIISADLTFSHYTENSSWFKNIVTNTDSRSNTSESPGYKVGFGISMTIPIISKEDRIHNIYNTRKKIKHFSDVYEHQVNDSKSRISELIKNIRSLRESAKYYKTAIDHQTATIEASMMQYDLGRSSDIVSVLQQKKNLYDILSRQTDNMIKYLNYIYQLKSITGQLTAKKLNLKVSFHSEKSHNLKG